MTKTQACIAGIVIVFTIGVVALAVHRHSQEQASGGATAGAPAAPEAPSQTQLTAAAECITLCQTAYNGSGTGAPSAQETACENLCNKSAGLPVGGAGTGTGSTAAAL